MEVWISEYLNKTDRGKPVVCALKNVPNVDLREIPVNKNEWCRDYMPVKGANGQLVLFKYLPSYLLGNKKDEATIPDQKLICDKLELDYKSSDIIFDGGAIEIFEDIAIISDRVVFENCSTWSDTEANVFNEIKERLGLNKLTVVPSDPWDFTGHVDGLVRFIDKRTVLINDASSLDESIKDSSIYIKKKYNTWKANFLYALKNAGLAIEILPCAVGLNAKGKDATGIYLNFLLLEDKIIMPSFEGLPTENKNAERKLKELYYRDIYPVEAIKLAREGGIINCVTWTN